MQLSAIPSVSDPRFVEMLAKALALPAEPPAMPVEREVLDLDACRRDVMEALEWARNNRDTWWAMPINTAAPATEGPVKEERVAPEAIEAKKETTTTSAPTATTATSAAGPASPVAPSEAREHASMRVTSESRLGIPTDLVELLAHQGASVASVAVQRWLRRATNDKPPRVADSMGFLQGLMGRLRDEGPPLLALSNDRRAMMQ